ncbi:MAG: peptide deformylase [Bacteroidales bacterium]
MALSEIKKLGDPVLLMKSETVNRDELPGLLPYVEKMWSLIIEFRQVYGRGRAIAAPQIGLLKRIICLNIDTPLALINPCIEMKSEELIEVWDDCMSFPDLLVLVKRHRMIDISFYDLQWKRHVWSLKDDMSELLQHEYDHLDGILAISRNPDVRYMKWVDK